MGNREQLDGECSGYVQLADRNADTLEAVMSVRRRPYCG